MPVTVIVLLVTAGGPGERSRAGVACTVNVSFLAIVSPLSSNVRLVAPEIAVPACSHWYVKLAGLGLETEAVICVASLVLLS